MIHVDDTTIRCAACDSLMPTDWVLARAWEPGQAAYLDGDMTPKQLRLLRPWRLRVINGTTRRPDFSAAASDQPRTPNGNFDKKAGK
jgi:hypothetical protein